MRNSAKTLTQVETIDGRNAQFDEMIEAVEQYQKKYRGVRGELIKKLHDELMRLKPAAVAAAPASAAPALQLTASPDEKPSCRACGRSMADRGDGTLVCQNGHTRLVT